jgi:2-polyprenyl-6-hydroxyphenyl methylase/3-demethylubiquinone-9 3-methyltransferase
LHGGNGALSAASQNLQTDARNYHYGEPAANDFRHHDYLIPAVLSILKDAQPKRLLDLGCGNGLATHILATHGYRINGVDPSEEGINWARAHYPDIEVHQGSAYDDLRARFGTFPVVISLEVVEHLYDPRTYVRTLFNLVEPASSRGIIMLQRSNFSAIPLSPRSQARGLFHNHFASR